MPAYAEAFVNLRIHSAQTLQEVRGHNEATEFTRCYTVTKKKNLSNQLK